jgi:hypothetical protein
LRYVFLLLTLLLGGCAGSAVGISNAPDSREIKQGAESIIVSNDGGVWAATYRDYLAKFIFVDARGLLSRKLGLTAAIESASGCKVTESTTDNMNITMHASVACVAKPSAPARPSAPAIAATPSEARIAGADTLQAESYARAQGCSATPRAALIAKGPGYETYSLACNSGDTIMVRCEYGNCRALR